MMPAFRLHFPSASATVAAIALALLSSCAMGPDYQKPDTTAITPAAWRWQPAAPRDTAPRGEWWTVFRDADLNNLEGRALAGSQTLKAGVARVLQARANARAEATGFFPDIRLNSSAKREQTSGNLPSPVPVSIPAARINTFDAGFDLSYEIDFWGKVRRSWESARASADASEADFHNMLLTLTGDVAVTYFTLRAADAELAALRRTIGIRENAFRFTNMKFEAGTVGKIDLARSQTELDTARAELADVQRQRREAADTLALLCGEPA
ncbi:MAG: RND transporter, partial [Verrucomicrobiaceae bacterium]